VTIHKEGYVSLALAALVLGVGNTALYFAAPPTAVVCVVGTISVLLFLIVLQFFRNPTCVTVAAPNEIIAPADGKVVVIEETTDDEYLKGRTIQVSIFMSPFNVHVNRSPVAGLVDYFKYHPGKFLVAWHPKSSTENERTTLGIITASGATVMLRQIAGALARRIVWYTKEGDALKTGEEYGFIKFGSRVDVFLPIGTEICVNLNDKTTGGKTIIARLK
jgi:phosphatidylserine decarboxylase